MYSCKKLVWLSTAIAILLISISGLLSCRPEGRSKIRLHVYHADSLLLPFQQIESGFEKKYPGIDVLLDGHGSIQVIRSVTELGQDVDVAATADSQLVHILMYDTQMKNGNGPFADWCIDFAANSLGIAYTAKSRYSSEINVDNWYQIMSRPDVKIGFADPRIDSLGYRVLMAVKLAEDYYRDDTLFEQLFAGAFIEGLDISSSRGITTITVPQLLKPARSRIVLRSYSLQLSALLESGDIDYSFEYESVARQRGFKFLELPPEFNLSSPDFAAQYQQMKVTMDFQRFATVSPVFKGSPIIYGITIPLNALHPPEAVEFIDYLLGPDGQRVLSANYQPPLAPAVTDNLYNTPAELRIWLK